MSDIISILENLKQEDYELWIRTQGKSHLSEEQWDWLIETVKERSKNESKKESINLADKEANKEVKQEV